MRKLLLLLVVGFLAWHVYNEQNAPASGEANKELQEFHESQADAPPLPEPEFRCDGREHCSQMRSCAEAEFFLENCPGVKMDGDHDGRPCERGLCEGGSG
jgi:hypothetical protein